MEPSVPKPSRGPNGDINLESDAIEETGPRLLHHDACGRVEEIWDIRVSGVEGGGTGCVSRLVAENTCKKVRKFDK